MGAQRKYTVYNNRTDMPVIVDGTSEEAARACGLTLASFYCAVTGQHTGNNNHWTILVEIPPLKRKPRKKRPPVVKTDKQRKKHPYSFYTVYNNFTDEMVCLDALAEDAAFAMGIQFQTFYPTVARVKNGTNKKWNIEISKGEQ